VLDRDGVGAGQPEQAQVLEYVALEGEHPDPGRAVGRRRQLLAPGHERLAGHPLTHGRYQPRSARRCSGGTTLRPTIGSPSPRETLATMAGSVG
jgi:hypothetical protein